MDFQHKKKVTIIVVPFFKMSSNKANVSPGIKTRMTYMYKYIVSSKIRRAKEKG